MMLVMQSNNPKETWQTIGDLARALAAKLRAMREGKDETGGRHLNVPPGSAAANVPDSSSSKAERNRDRLVVPAIGPDKPDNIGRNQGSRTTLAATGVSPPVLSVTVSTVVGSRPEEEVIRIDATGDVAFVKDALAGWDRSVRHSPSGAMGHPSPTFGRELAVPEIIGQAAKPKETSAVWLWHAEFVEGAREGCK